MSLLDQFNISLDNIKDTKIKDTIIALFNIIEDQSATIKALQEENQRLKDENNNLKGEQGKPDIKPKNKSERKDISSETERKTTKKKNRKDKSKKDKIKIDREEKCTINKEDLPEDAEFKGYQDVVVQDISVKTDNIEFHKEIYYSRSLNKTFIAKLPLGYEGEFGPNIKALTITLKNVSNMSEPKILELFHQFGIEISASTISNFLIKNKEDFHREKREIFRAGLESSQSQQIDDTSARVNGENYYTQILCNEFYSAFFTNPRKDRLTILDILNEFGERSFIFNQETISLLEQMRVNKYIIDKLKCLRGEMLYNEKQLKQLLAEIIPNAGKIQVTRVIEASAIAAYHRKRESSIVKIFVCDDAPQFKLLTELLALCWIHEGKHYKKLDPVVPYNIRKLKLFLKKFWEYYHKLLTFKNHPLKSMAKKLSKEFDVLFSTKTGYEQLDERIKKTKSKKQELLLVLKHPEIPLHNNAAELAARAQVRKRDVSLQTRTEEGTEANDTFLTIVQTAKKLGYNIYDYILDRVNKKFSMPSLADTIKSRSSPAII